MCIIIRNVYFIQGAYEQIQIPTTEDEKMEELDNIRSLPISMNEKKMYRCASFQYFLLVSIFYVRVNKFLNAHSYFSREKKYAFL